MATEKTHPTTMVDKYLVREDGSPTRNLVVDSRAGVARVGS